MASSLEAPQQHSQPSRKGKKAWRKNVNVTEIQEGLETARDEVIKGGIIAEKPSADLFILDTAGSETIQKSYNKTHKPLKSDQILALRSAVPAVDSRKRSRTTDGVVEPKTKRRKNGVSPGELERLKQRAYGGETAEKDIIALDLIPEHDPWEDIPITQPPQFSFLEAKKPIRAPATLKAPPVSLLENKKPMPAVPKPTAGTSYNPLFSDWDELLLSEGAKEVLAEQKRIKDTREEDARLAKIAAAQDERDDLQTEDESAWEGIESEYEDAGWLSKKRPERKTPVERNKIKRRKEAERTAKHLTEMKRRAQQAQQIKAIAMEFKTMDMAAPVAAVESSDESADDRVLRRRKLGREALPERSLELLLPDELQDSLRLLKPQGNLLKDRFRNILVRGKMETRKAIQQPKKKKRSYTEKWTYKDFTISG